MFQQQFIIDLYTPSLLSKEAAERILSAICTQSKLGEMDLIIAADAQPLHVVNGIQSGCHVRFMNQPTCAFSELQTLDEIKAFLKMTATNRSSLLNTADNQPIFAGFVIIQAHGTTCSYLFNFANGELIEVE